MKNKTRKTLSYLLASALILGGALSEFSGGGLSAQAAGTTYRVLSGGDENHPHGSSSGLNLLVEAPSEEFTGILVDGQVLDPVHYSIEAASNSSKPPKSDTSSESGQEPAAEPTDTAPTTQAPPTQTSQAPTLPPLPPLPTPATGGSWSVTPEATQSLDSSTPVASQPSFLQSLGTALKNAFTGITAEAASSRCTKIKVKADYLNSLPNGTRTMTITYTGGQAVTTFSISDSPVVAQDTVPKTGVASHSDLFGILAIAGGLAVIYFERKRKIHAE